MTSADTVAPEVDDSPLMHARCFVHCFGIMFSELFVQPRPTFIVGAVYRKACAWLRGLEAIARRVLMIQAVTLVPDLPPARPRAEARTAARPVQTPQPAAAPEGFGRGSFCLLPRPAARRAAARQSRPQLFPQTVFALRPLARRYNAIIFALQYPEAAARRLAFRVRASHAAHGLVQLPYSVRIHPEQAPVLVHDLEAFTCDANDGLRALFYADTS